MYSVPFTFTLIMYCFLWFTATLPMYSVPFTFTLIMYCFLWGGPHSNAWVKIGGPHLLLLQSSVNADTGCFPAKSLQAVMVATALPFLLPSSSAAIIKVNVNGTEYMGSVAV